MKNPINPYIPALTTLFASQFGNHYMGRSVCYLDVHFF